jgi:hypothetical protein
LPSTSGNNERTPHSIGSCQKFQAGEEIGRDRPAILFLNGIDSIVYKARGGAVDDFACAAAKGIVGEGCCDSRATDRRQLIAGVPGIGRRPAGVGKGCQVTVEIVRLRTRAKRGLLIIRVVDCRLDAVSYGFVGEARLVSVFTLEVVLVQRASTYLPSSYLLLVGSLT